MHFGRHRVKKKAEESFEALKKFGFINAKFLWKRDKCKNGYIKDLSVVAENFPEYNSNNIIIVDDSDHKIINRDRFIKISSFNIYSVSYDDRLVILRDYIKRLLKNIKENKFDNGASFMKNFAFNFC